MRFPLIAATVLSVLSTAPASAQTWAGQRGVSVADQHRYETERLRQRSQDQASFARQTQLNARLTQQELQAARQPEPYIPLQPLVPQTPEAAQRAREAMVSGVTQIDDWLARAPQPPTQGQTTP